MEIGISKRNSSIITHLIIINVLVWISQSLLPKIGIDVTTNLGLHYWKGSEFNPIQLVTYMFLHNPNSFVHIFCNMFMLFMFGTDVHRVLDNKRFIFFYLATGIGAGIVQELAWTYDLLPFAEEIGRYVEAGSNGALLNINIGDGRALRSVGEVVQFANDVYNNFLTVGASGAMFGLLIAFAMIFPNRELFFMFIPIPIKAKYMVIGYSIIELFLGVQNFQFDTIAHFAHLGGALFGLIIMLYWRKQGKDRMEKQKKMFEHFR